MKMRLWVAFAWLVAGSAMAQDDVALVCTAPPAPPTPYTAADLPPKPVLPPCVNPKTHLSTCSKPALNKYNASVDAYNAALEKVLGDSNDYIDQLNKYQRDVNTYGNCEVRRVNGLIRVTQG